jgi:hypothetical protein
MLRLKRKKGSPRGKRGANKHNLPDIVAPGDEEVHSIFEDTIMKEYSLVVSRTHPPAYLHTASQPTDR